MKAKPGQKLAWVMAGIAVDLAILVLAVLGYRLEQLTHTLTGEPAEYGLWAFMAGWAIINGALHTMLLRSIRAQPDKSRLQA